MEPVPPPPPVVIPHVDVAPPPPPTFNTSPQIMLHAAPPNRISVVLKHLIFSIPLALVTGLIGYVLGLGNGSQIATNFLNLVKKNPPTAVVTTITPTITDQPTPGSNLTTITLEKISLTYQESFKFVDPTASDSAATNAFSFNFVSGSTKKTLGALVLNRNSYLTFNNTVSDEPTCKIISRNEANELLPLVKKFNQTSFYAGQVNGVAAGTTYTHRVYHTWYGGKCYEVVVTHSNSSDIVDENIYEIWQQLESPLQTLSFL